MTVTLFWVGKTKENFIKEAIKKYIRDIGALGRADVRVVEIKEEKGEKARAAALRREGGRILRQAGDFVLLDEGGKMMTSVEFAGWLGEKFQSGQDCRFVIGGPYGVSQEVKDAAAHRVSLSPMTFPHELARVMLLEQIYRAFSILKGRAYHHA